jgi:hypothetical protein
MSSQIFMIERESIFKIDPEETKVVDDENSSKITLLGLKSRTFLYFQLVLSILLVPFFAIGLIPMAYFVNRYNQSPIKFFKPQNDEVSIKTDNLVLNNFTFVKLLTTFSNFSFFNMQYSND